MLNILKFTFFIHQWYTSCAVKDDSGVETDMSRKIPAEWKGVVDIDQKMLVIDDKIGKGAFGSVTGAHLKCDASLRFAIKKQVLTDGDPVIMATNELMMMRTNHPRLIHAFAYHMGETGTSMSMFSSSKKKYWILTLRANSDVDHAPFNPRRENGTDDKLTALLLARDLLSGMAYMHNTGIVHRDIKPANLLWFCPQDETKLCGAVIADFGLACSIRKIEKSLLTGNVSLYDCPYALAGTLGYIPSNVTKRHKTAEGFYNSLKGGDMYAVGLTLLMVLRDRGMVGFGSVNKRKSLQRYKGSDIWPLVELLLKMIDRPARRPSAEEALTIVDQMLLEDHKIANSETNYNVQEVSDKCTADLRKLRVTSALPAL